MSQERWVTIHGRHILLKYNDGKLQNDKHLVSGSGSSSSDNLKRLSELTKVTVDKLDAKVGNSNVQLSSSRPTPEHYMDNFVLDNSDLGIGGGGRGEDRYLNDCGHNDFVVQDAKALLRLHGGTNWNNIDLQIIEHLKTDSDIGKVFKDMIKFEEASYKAWLSRHNDPETSWKYGVFNGEKRIYRKGDRKTGVEPWSVNEEGADFGRGGIGYDHMSTIEQQLKEGYHIIGGIANHWGSIGDAEITFVRW